jgi:hypothetical protein
MKPIDSLSRQNASFRIVKQLDFKELIQTVNYSVPTGAVTFTGNEQLENT